jgi:hypothetical protein
MYWKVVVNAGAGVLRGITWVFLEARMAAMGQTCHNVIPRLWPWLFDRPDMIAWAKAEQ